VKLRFEEARRGRTAVEGSSFYCPSCVVDHEIPVVEAPPSGEDPLVLRRSRRSRVGPIDVGSGELSLPSRRLRALSARRAASRQQSPAPAPRRAGAGPWIGGLVLGLAIAGGVAALSMRNGDAAGASAGPVGAATQAAVSASVGGNVPAAVTGPTASAPERAPSPGAVPPTGQPEAQDAQAPLVGASTTEKVHRPECRHARKIAADNRVALADLAAALRQGFVPCRVCLRGEQ
jgi:hypothetical protein